MIFKTVLTIALLGIVTTAHAGDQKGAGGGGVVCRNADGSISSVTTLDVYEAKFRDMNLDFGPHTPRTRLRSSTTSLIASIALIGGHHKAIAN